MKTIGIITILKTNNYGAELQAYATQAILNKLGHNAEIIDYLFYKNPGHIITKASKPSFNHGLKKRLSEKLYPIIARIKAKSSTESCISREKRFETFHTENTRMSQTYRTIDELYATKKYYDVYMVGSDQVWNPGIYSSLLPYMLAFAPEGKKKVAYASSFGVSAIPQDCQWLYKKYLPGFSSIGVREKNAVEMVKELGGKDATWVLDPTLLLNKEDWSKVASNIYADKKNYILLYELTPCPYILELAKYFREKKGLDIVRICKNAAIEDKDSSIENIIEAGPAEFVRLFANAGMVITNSFHGTAFSINFGKEFYTITPTRKHNNSRQRSILELFKLQDRLIAENTPIENISMGAVDYAAVSQILEDERKKSIEFLTNSIDK